MKMFIKMKETIVTVNLKTIVRYCKDKESIALILFEKNIVVFNEFAFGIILQL